MPMPFLHSTNDADRLLTEVQAAEILNLSVRTLQAWRLRGAGPSFVRAGRAIRYRHRDLLAWMDANTVGRQDRRTDRFAP
jgi:predicted DNA-binding transcriptional regulator AlpA